MKRLYTLILAVLFFLGCGADSGPFGLATALQPILPASEGDVEYIEDHAEQSRLLIRQDGVTVLATVVHGNRCPTGGHSGEQLDISRAFVGTSGQPSVGDTLGGSVILSTVIDTLAITEGRFHLTAVSPDTLEGFAWVRLASSAACSPRDSLVRPLRLILQP